jgi:hypothetical protein
MVSRDTNRVKIKPRLAAAGVSNAAIFKFSDLARRGVP